MIYELHFCEMTTTVGLVIYQMTMESRKLRGIKWGQWGSWERSLQVANWLVVSSSYLIDSFISIVCSIIISMLWLQYLCYTMFGKQYHLLNKTKFIKAKILRALVEFRLQMDQLGSLAILLSQCNDIRLYQLIYSWIYFTVFISPVTTVTRTYNAMLNRSGE